MIEFDVSALIARPIEVVFEFVSNLENSPQWQSVTVDATKPSAGPIGVGTTWRETTKVLGRRFEVERETTAYEPSGKFAVKATSGPMQLEVTVTVTLESVDGGTQFNAAV